MKNSDKDKTVLQNILDYPKLAEYYKEKCQSEDFRIENKHYSQYERAAITDGLFADLINCEDDYINTEKWRHNNRLRDKFSELIYKLSYNHSSLLVDLTKKGLEVEKQNIELCKELNDIIAELRNGRHVESETQSETLNKDTTAKKKRLETTDDKINSLKDYFISTFKGMGNETNKFEEYLKHDLKKQRTKKELAAIALIIFESDIILSSSKPRCFTDWLKIFFDVYSIEAPTYKPNKLKDEAERLKPAFYYLKK